MHKLLTRQLSRLEINPDELPTKAQWVKLLAHIDRTYDDADQERYLLERSMAISSRELSELNTKLQSAQKIAHLGYWVHDTSTGENSWSKELYSMYELDYSTPPPDLAGVFAMVHPDDRERLQACVARAQKHGDKYEIEIRMKGFGPNATYRWYLVIAQPSMNKNNEYTRIFGIAMDIQNQKEFDETVSTLNEQLVQSARKAGMAEVATAILHNIGNVLNSTNVSVDMLAELNHANYYERLFSLQNLLSKHIGDFKSFINTDPKGEATFVYLYELINKIKETHLAQLNEITDLKKSIVHIKDIIELQQNLSRPTPSIEKISITATIKDALDMTSKNFGKLGIKLHCQTQDYLIRTDKNRLLQILVNLIQNAKDALLQSSLNDKHITIKLATNDQDKVMISISDNGVGINGENLSKVFTFGFSTKSSGHGYGLHSSALTAKELGGELSVESQGEGQGAKFILSLPVNFQGKKKLTEEKINENSHY